VLREFLAIDKVVVNAVCDVVKEKCLRAAQMIEKAGQKTPAIYSNGERDFEQLSHRDDLDFVYIATPWEWHVRNPRRLKSGQACRLGSFPQPTPSKIAGTLLTLLKRRGDIA